MNEYHTLIVRAASLARSAPREWEDFLKAYKAYVDTKKDQCVAAARDTLLVAQGCAREAGALQRLFNECVVTADKIAEKK